MPAGREAATVMGQDPGELAQILSRLKLIEERLRRLEAATKLPPLADFVSEPFVPRPAAASAAQGLSRPPIQPGPITPVWSQDIAELPEALPVLESPPSPPVKPWTLRPAIPPAPEPSYGRNLEETIGLRWAGWIGSIVLVIGVGLGIKFAYDNGWFGHLPVPVRLMLMSLVGVALLAAGEIVYRRVNVVSAAGLFGGGVAVLFLVSYAGHVYYHAYSYETGFVFAVFTVLIGSLVAMRGLLVSIAVLSQLGGGLGPLVLSTGQPPGVALLAYLLMLQIVALILCLWAGSPKWWILRFVSLAITAIWVLVALATGHWAAGPANEVLLFCIISAAVYQGELVRSALDTGELEHFATMVVRGSAATMSLLVNAGLGAVALHTFYQWDSRLWRGGFVLTQALLCLAGGLRLPARRDSILTALAESYRTQAVALLVLFVPVTLTSYWISLAWGILAVALASLGRRFDRTPERIAAVATWLLAILRFGFDVSLPRGILHEIWFSLLGHPTAGRTVIGLAVAVLGLALAWFLQADVAPARRPAARWEKVAIAATAIASLVWWFTSIDGFPRPGATLLLVLWAWLLVALDYLPQHLRLALHAMIILTVAGMKWVISDVAYSQLGPQASATDYWPVLNPTMATGVCLAASLAAVARLRAATLRREINLPAGELSGSSVVEIIIVLLLTIGLSFEVNRFVERLAAVRYSMAISPMELRLLLLTWLWLAAVLIVALNRPWVPLPAAWIQAVAHLSTLKFLFIDLLGYPFASSPLPKVWFLANFEVITACAVIATLLLIERLAPVHGSSPSAITTRTLVNGLALLVVLRTGTAEIDRLFSVWLAPRLSDPVMAKHAAISIFWGLFAMALIAAGFRLRAPLCRYAGLGLFGITLVKVIVLDMREVQYGYRVLAFIGLGLLLLATSVIYCKLAAVIDDKIADQARKSA
jgi:uncharacterized membrane protein